MQQLGLAAATTAPQPTDLSVVAEISHRVVNEYSQAISDLRRAAAQSGCSEARARLTAAAMRLTRCAEVHRTLQAPITLDGIDVGESLARFCAALAAAWLDERGIRLILRTDTVVLPAPCAWRVILIVSELITNALRHGLRARAGVIQVELEAGASGALCRVSDNGDAVAPPRPGRGMAVARALAAEIDGKLEWTFTNSGARVELTLEHIGTTRINLINNIRTDTDKI